MPRIVRTFVAVEASPEVRSRASQIIARLRPAGANVKWVEPRNLHMTLKFLGEVDLREIAAVCEAVSAAANACGPFSMRLSTLGAFPDLVQPRTIWLGVDDGAEEMVALHERVEVCLSPLGFRREQRRFRPHLTIGRVRGPQRVAALRELIVEHERYEAGVMDVDELVVFSSQLERSGPVYDVLGTAGLEGT